MYDMCLSMYMYIAIPPSARPSTPLRALRVFARNVSIVSYLYTHGGPRLMPNAGPTPFDWAHRGEVGNDNGYRYSLFSIFDYEVLKYSGRPARSGHEIVIASRRSRPLPTAAVTRARIRDCMVHERAHSSANTFIYTATLVGFNPIVSASRMFFFFTAHAI